MKHLFQTSACLILNAAVILTLGLQLYRRTPASKQWWPGGQRIANNSGIEPTIFKSKSLLSSSWPISTDSSSECHCWWTSESPRAYVAKFYGRLRLIRSVLGASKLSVLNLIEIVISWVYYTIPFGFSLFLALSRPRFSTFKLLCLAKDHWRGFFTRNVHMVHIVH